MKCAACGQKITFWDRMLGRVHQRPGEKVYHNQCFRMERIALRTGMAVSGPVWGSLRRSSERIERAQVHSTMMLSERLRGDARRHEAVIIEATKEVPVMLQEARKILYWLEMNGARRDERAYDGVVNPEVVTLLEKVSGMSAEELSREIKDRDLKRALNRHATNAAKNGKTRKKG